MKISKYSDIGACDLLIINNKRFWEIDLLRGIAIIMMIIFHILYYLKYFNIFTIDLSPLYLRIFNYSIGSIFILLVGISFTLSYSRVENKLSKKEMEMEAKLAMALQLFEERRISAGKAAEVSGLPLADFMEATRLHRIEWVDYTDEELEAEIRESVLLGQNLR